MLPILIPLPVLRYLDLHSKAGGAAGALHIENYSIYGLFQKPKMEIELEVTASVAIQRKKPWSRFAWLKEVSHVVA